MALVAAGAQALDYLPCRYGGSKVLFRGPERRLEGAFCVVLGSTETFGKFVPRPYPALVEAILGREVVNLGSVNGGVDLFLGDRTVAAAIAEARVTVVQAMGAHTLSNRFYSVHPRRNDRVVRVAPALRALFPGIDFAEMAFARHLLSCLAAADAGRFAAVAEELRVTWVARMRALLARAGGARVLLWLSRRSPAETAPPGEIGRDPPLIGPDMIGALRPELTEVVEVVASPDACARGTEGMVYGPLEALAAAELPGPAVHAEAAAALAAALERLAPRARGLSRGGPPPS